MNAAALHVIVQAGGRGSRLRHHTWNKPKCLVSIRGKPLLYHVFERFPQAHFHVIGDYGFERLECYLNMNVPPAAYTLVRADGKGTSSGIARALEAIPPHAPVLLTWSDLIIGELPPWPEAGSPPVVFTTSAFTCRWSVGADGELREAPSASTGIPGLFYFPRAEQLDPPPPAGEFVAWLAQRRQPFRIEAANQLEELGDFAAIEDSNSRSGFSRFFNRVEIEERQVVKTVIDPAYESLHAREVQWYRDARALGFRRIPKVLGEAPLTLERIHGMHAYEMHDLTERERRAVLADYLDSLTALHDKAAEVARPDEIEQVYLRKTIDRVMSVAAIIPGFQRDSLTVNGRKCRNLFAEKHRGTLEKLLPALVPQSFTPIHGDATFSNTLIDDKLRVWFIDPRGYFARPGIFGDPWYDFAKVYYSAVGGYDAFNRRRFKLHVDDETVEVLMEESGFAATARDIFRDYFGPDLARIEILHGLIWLALSGYARDDIDSVIGSFYLGLYWLEAGHARA